MKLKTSWLVAGMMLAMATTLFVGCSDNSTDNPTDTNTPNTILFTDLSAEEQASLAESMVEESIYSIVGMRETVIDLASGNFYGVGSIGFSAPVPAGFHAKQMIATPPDTSWTGPDAQGFYTQTYSQTYDGVTFTWSNKVKFTPDIWDDAHAGEDVTGAVVQYSYEQSGGTEGAMTMSGEYSFTLNEARTYFDGSMDFSLTYAGTDPTMDAGEYSYTATWQNVALSNEEFGGQYTFTWDLHVLGLDDNNQLADFVIAFDSDFDFQTNGQGTGSSSVNDIEMIRYSFNAVNPSSPRTGFYTLKSENFSVQHPFSVDAN